MTESSEMSIGRGNPGWQGGSTAEKSSDGEPMRVLTGVPDWQGSFSADEFTFLTAYAQERIWFMIPRAMRLLNKSGKPDFFLEFVSDRTGSLPEDSLYANLDMGLMIDANFDKASRLIADQKISGSLVPAPLAPDSWWLIESGDVHESQPFAWEHAERARIIQRLPKRLGLLIFGALDKGSAPVIRTAIECEVASFLPRAEIIASFETAALLDALQNLSPLGGVPFRAMIEFFNEQHAGMIAFEGSDSGFRRGLGLALAGRVRHFFGKRMPSPYIGNGPFIALPPTGSNLPKDTAWDLRTPLLTTVPLFLDFDPFTPIRAEGGRDAFVKLAIVPPLPAERLAERVSVLPNLPANFVTHQAIELTLRVNGDLSATGHVQRETITLYPPSLGPIWVELKFKRSDAKKYSYRVTAIPAISEDGLLESDWIERRGDFLLADRSLLPGKCVTVSAASELLEQASVAVEIVSGPTKFAAALEKQAPVASFLLRAGFEEARLKIVAHDPADASKTESLDLPCASIAVDLPAFRQYGLQIATVRVVFPPGNTTADFEFQPEAPGSAPRRISFTNEAQSQTFAYFATQIFRNRFRYRPAPEVSGAETEWSEYHRPGIPLTIQL